MCVSVQKGYFVLSAAGLTPAPAELEAEISALHLQNFK